MPYETVYIGAVLLSGGFALVVAAWLWSEDLGREAKVFTGFMALHPVVAVLVAAELLAPAGSDLAIHLYDLHNAVVVPVVPLWFAFAALYTDRRRWLSRPVLAAVGV